MAGLFDLKSGTAALPTLVETGTAKMRPEAVVTKEWQAREDSLAPSAAEGNL